MMHRDQLDIGPIIARAEAFGKRSPSPVINITPVVVQMHGDIMALIREVVRVRAALAEAEAVTPR